MPECDRLGERDKHTAELALVHMWQQPLQRYQVEDKRPSCTRRGGAQLVLSIRTPRPTQCVRVSLPQQSVEQYQVVIGGLHALEEVATQCHETLS